MLNPEIKTLLDRHPLNLAVNNVYYRLERGCWAPSQRFNHLLAPDPNGMSICDSIEADDLLNAGYREVQYLKDPTPQSVYHTFCSSLWEIETVATIRLVFSAIDRLTFSTWLQGTGLLKENITLVRITTTEVLPTVEQYLSEHGRSCPVEAMRLQGAIGMEFVPSEKALERIETFQLTVDQLWYYLWDLLVQQKHITVKQSELYKQQRQKRRTERGYQPY